MAKKKVQDTAPRPQPFKNTPFNALKGMHVPEPVPKAPEPPRPATPPVAKVVDEAALFLQAMEGVRRVDGQPAAATEKKAKPAMSAPSPVKAVAMAPADLADFTQAIGQLKLDKTFTEQKPEDEELKPLGGNRLRQLKRGVICVDRQLDLHGLIREEALEALPAFLRSAADHGEKAVLIITGKGNNSSTEPVLQQAVAGWLRDAGRQFVVEYAPAPREMGGSGAFVVFLRTGCLKTGISPLSSSAAL